MKRNTFFTIALTLCAAAIQAATFTAADVYEQEAPINADGMVVIDNPFGNVEVVGADNVTSVSFTVRRTVRGSEAGAIDDARQKSPLLFYGDNRVRVIRTGVPVVHDMRWTIGVAYVIRVPRGVALKISSHSSERIHVTNVNGPVEVKNTSGNVVLDSVAGAISVESANGSIIVDSPTAPANDISLTTINGNIELSLPTSATSFRWTGQTLRGDFFSSIPIAGKFTGPNFRASLNNTGPQITTNSLMGNVYMLRRGSKPADAKSVRAMTGVQTPTLVARSFQAPFVNGDLIYSTPLGNISVGQVRGAARVETQAGEVRLGVIQSQAEVVSNGGPLTIGEVMGPLTARTRAGDIMINAAHDGAVVSTGGGLIRILFASGVTNLHTLGGDIIVRQASGPITAVTSSGDVTVALDPGVRSAAVDLKTEQGNVMLTATSSLAADIEATLVTSDPDTNAIHSDFAGLTIRREQVGTKTRIRASGRVNGGGERVYLYAEDGDITIRAGAASPVISGAVPQP